MPASQAPDQRARTFCAAGLLALLMAAPAPAQDVRVGLVGQPIFYTCVRNIPVPATAPAGIKPHLEGKVLRECGGPDASGKILIVDIFDDTGGVPAGKKAIQTVSVNGAHYRMNPATGACDRKVKFRVSITEYFDSAAGQPARDHHAAAECCEARFEERVSVRTIIAPLPAGARPPVPGFGVGYAYTTPAERTAIEAKIRADARVLWGYRYEYDGCNAPPRTPSATRHHMRYSLRQVGGPSGEIVFNSDR